MTIFFDSDRCNSTAVLRPQTPTTVGKYRPAEVEASPAAVRDHLDHLLVAGMTRARIAALAGVSEITITRITRGRPIRPRTAQALLNVTVDIDPVAIDRHLAGDTTVRLTRAEKRAAFCQLRAAGHTVSAISHSLSLSGTTGQLYEAARVRLIVLEADHAATDDNREATG